jgi:hypothetical protein
MGKKLLVSLAMEGKLHVEGLQTMDEDDDMLTAMARELVTRQGVGEQAAEIWRLMKTNQPASGASVINQSSRAEPTEPRNEPEQPKPCIPSSRPAVQLSLF